MSRSQTDGEEKNQGRVLDAAERASLGAFLTPAPKPRTSVAPPSVRPGAPGVPKMGGETVQGPRPFWEAPVLRSRPSNAIIQAAPAVEEVAPEDEQTAAEIEKLPVSASGPPSSQGASSLAAVDAGWIDPGEPLPESARSEPLPPPRPPPVPSPVEVATAPARPDSPEPPPSSVPPAGDGPSARPPPAITPSTLAPAAYDTVSGRDELDGPNHLQDSEALEGDGVARPFFRSSTTPALLAAAAAVILIGGLALRGRGTPVPADDARSEPAAQTIVAPTADVPPTPPDPSEEPAVTEPKPDPANAAELQRRARELLVTGQIVEGVAFARQAIAANPNDGENYILLAAGLQDLGRWQEARIIFTQCIRRSGGPASTECVYFATTGK
jgi:hypothetical protein